jgi:hypothetical protein
LPHLAGFEGPLPGRGEADWPRLEAMPRSLLLHWQNAVATVDLRWPSDPPPDPTTPVPPGATSVSEGQPNADGPDPAPAGPGRWAAHATVFSQVIGAGRCSGLDLTVTAASPDGTELALDQVESALTGPGGPLEPEGPLVTGPTTTADDVPPLGVCDDGSGERPDVLGAVDNASTYPAPRDALAAFVPTEPRLPNRGYHEIALSDGSFGYAYPDAEEPTALVRVAPRNGGWSVSAFGSAGC